jgi:hypothetical protein
MARKFLAVCGLLLITLFQFGRAIDFWQCELFNFGNSNATCNCDKISTDANANTQQAPSQKESRDRLADLFDFPVRQSAAGITNNVISMILRQSRGRLSQGFGEEMLQPPRV